LERLVLLVQRNGESKAQAEATTATQGIQESVLRIMSARIRVWADLGWFSPFWASPKAQWLGQP